jgi:putative membrane-bound dehydrogenase-like protein
LITASVLIAAVIAVPLTFSPADFFASERPRRSKYQEQEAVSTPEEALAKIELPRGFTATLFAHEPAVQQPVALTTDDRGRVWVAEQHSYKDETRSLDDRIIILEDSDNDGVHDRRTVFRAGLKNLTGIEIGFGGVWAMCPPQLLFIPDSDRDDVPDSDAVVMLDGWAPPETGIHTIANGLRWGPDGWLYGRQGLFASSHVGHPEAIFKDRIHLAAGIWRFHPRHKTVESVARGTVNPWGMDWDQHGQLFFINTVIGHLWHAVPGAVYEMHDPATVGWDVYETLGQTADHSHWGEGEEGTKIRTLGVTRTTDRAGGGHAHAGAMIYQGDNWPKAFRHGLFTVNLHGRRLNNDRLARRGAAYVGTHGRDFLRSRDPSFRSVDVLAGHDGGVYVADWTDVGECHENDGVHRESGRIYKITYGRPAKPAIHDVGSLGSLELVALQTHGNDWFSRHARRVLHERACAGEDMTEVRRALLLMLERSADAVHALRAFWCLNLVAPPDERRLLDQLTNNDEHMRVWAIRALSDRGHVTAPTLEAFTSLADTDTSGLVLLFLASAMQSLPPSDRWSLARRLSTRADFADDPVLPLMMWYGVGPVVPDAVEQSVELITSARIPRLRRLLARRVTSLIDVEPGAVDLLIARLTSCDDADTRLDILAGMNEALQGYHAADIPRNWPAAVAALRSDRRQSINRLVQELDIVFGTGRLDEELRRIATSPREGDAARRAALRHLVARRAGDVVPLLRSLLDDPAIGVDAIHGLAAFDDPDTPALLFRYLATTPGFAFAPGCHAKHIAALSTLTSRASFARVLLSEVEAHRFPQGALSALDVSVMRSHADADMAARLDRLWPTTRPHPGAAATMVERYASQLTPDVLAQADLGRGRLLFSKQCATCHSLFGEGARVGPDLTGSQRSNLQYVLSNIVDPSAIVQPSYRMHVIILDDGRVLNGIVSQQDSRAITIQLPHESFVIARSKVVEMRATEQSLMPVGQLDALTLHERRDLIAYVMSPVQVPFPVAADASTLR